MKFVYRLLTPDIKKKRKKMKRRGENTGKSQDLKSLLK